MNSMNWEKFGQEISKTVQDAVENQNYDKLNQVITDTVNQAADTVANGMKSAVNASQTKYKEYKEKKTYASYKTYTTDQEYAKKEKPQFERTSGMQFSNVGTRHVPVTIKTKAPSKSGAIVMTVLGYALGGSQLFGMIAGLIVMLVTHAAISYGEVILGSMLVFFMLVLTVIGFVLGMKGAAKIGKINRFKQYLAAIGQKEYCNISELASRVGKKNRSVIKDIEYMIQQQWFLQGHLDKQKTCLMVTDKIYTEYCQLEQQKAIELKEAKEREIEYKKQQEERSAMGKTLPAEIQQVIEKGNDYVLKIRACNDAIPGEDISAKIARIEMLVDKIFDRVEQNPKCVSDIRKMMEYYLPTTVKLLEAYAEMDAQPTGGENIQTAKKEIEATLDTLNVAFEKLLDSLFQETAWDVSSDISVLNTMLAQEGLKEDGLKRK